MKAVIVLGQNVSPELAKARCEGAYVFGADRGALYCIRHGLPLNVAVGDFDSVKAAEKEEIKKAAGHVVELPTHKDRTDTAEALLLCENAESVTILGGIAGRRIEHFLANVDLLRSRPNTLFMEDNDSQCFVMSNSVVEVSKKAARYVSLFALDDAKITLTGFEYPLTNVTLKAGDPLGVSNRIISNVGQISCQSGLLLVIYHKTR